ncbi:MAG: Uma2 family endonuclease [Chloroflexi bacterium]|nr:Uma2 family endonuclease [Chloroflexota bacterium]
MATEQQRNHRYTVAEYFALEGVSETKYEYYEGEIVALAGASPNHLRLTMNVGGLLWSQLRGTECSVFPSDTRLRVSASRYVYPDATVVCGRPDFVREPLDLLLNPTVVAEVLSPSTEHRDRGQKFVFYRSIPTLRDYVMLEQDRVHVEHFSKTQAGLWVLREYEAITAVVELESIRARLPLGEVYAGVDVRSSGDE